MHNSLFGSYSDFYCYTSGLPTQCQFIDRTDTTKHSQALFFLPNGHTMSSSKRASTAPPPPKPPVQFGPSLTIADNAALTGTNLISIGAYTVIHPRTKLNSMYAPITIGSNCIVSERSQIGLQSAPSSAQREGVVIEDGVVVETGAVVEGRVGEGSVIEVNARIGKCAVIGKVVIVV